MCRVGTPPRCIKKVTTDLARSSLSLVLTSALPVREMWPGFSDCRGRRHEWQPLAGNHRDNDRYANNSELSSLVPQVRRWPTIALCWQLWDPLVPPAVPRQLLHDVPHKRLSVAEEHEVVVEVVERVVDAGETGRASRVVKPEIHFMERPSPISTSERGTPFLQRGERRWRQILRK